MGLGFDSPRARARVRIERWSWASWLVLCIISYPAVAAARVAPWAGLIGGLSAGAFLVATAGLGYAGHRALERWPRAVLIALAAAAAVGLAAIVASEADWAIALLLAAAAWAEIVFTWYFLPAIVREAETSGARSRSRLQLLPAAGRGAEGAAPALGLALLLGLLLLGLGSVWRRGEAWAPDPTPWLVLLILLALGLMFVERMTFFERSAREGNLIVPLGAFRRWVSAGLLLLAAAALLALAAPWKSGPELARLRRAGSALAPAAPAGPGHALAGGQTAAGGVAAAVRELPAGAPHRLALLLLLLLVLAALILIWGFSRTRAARWFLAVIGAALAPILPACKRFLAALWRWLFPATEQPVPMPGPAPDDTADPFRDVFDDPESLRLLSPREVLIRTYHLLLNFAEMLGHGRAIGQTPFEYALALERAAPQARDAVRVLTWGYAGAMYAERGTALLDPSAVRLAWRQLADALKADLTPEDFSLRRRAYLAARELEGR